MPSSREAAKTLCCNCPTEALSWRLGISPVNGDDRRISSRSRYRDTRRWDGGPGEHLVVRQTGLTYSVGMIAALVAYFLLFLSSAPQLAEAADVTPVPPSSPQSPSTPPPENAPARPPKVEPSPRDPGILKQPETVPHPDSVVTPPVVDPKMAVDPDAPTKEERHPMIPPEKTPQQAPRPQ